MMDIATDRQRGLLRLQLAGFWSAEDFDKFKRTYTHALADLGMAPNQHVILVDLREATLQTQALIADVQAFMANFGNRARRIALVAASALARMQTKRLAIRTDIVLFATMEAAEEWLFEKAVAA